MAEIYEEQVATNSRASRDKLGQVFSGSDDYTPTSIKLLLFQDGGTISALNVKFYTYAGGDPDSGTEICSGDLDTFSLPTYPTASEVREITLSCTENIENGLDYSFVITSNLQDGVGSDVQNTLSGSLYKFYSGSWGNGNSSLYYQIYGEAIEEEQPVGTSTIATTTADVMALGSITLGLGIIITLMMLGYAGFIFNRISNKKPWKH